MIDSMIKEYLGVRQVWGPHGPKHHLPTVPTLSLMHLRWLSLTRISFPLVHHASWDHFLNKLLLPLATLKVCCGGNPNHDSTSSQTTTTHSYPSRPPPSLRHILTSPYRKTSVSDTPFPCCPESHLDPHPHLSSHSRSPRKMIPWLFSMPNFFKTHDACPWRVWQGDLPTL